MRLSQQLRRAPVEYKPLSRIAAGGMAEVWKAQAVFPGGAVHQVAIKRVLPEMTKDPLFGSMFRDEARLGGLLRHPNIVRVYDARDIRGTFIVIMELVEGDSLKGVMDRIGNRALPITAALYVTRELCKALQYAHRATDVNGQPLGIIHRDVSPHNLLLSERGQVKLTDFGLADAHVHQTVRDPNMLGGKFGYLAPEIVRQEETDERIDIFAAGTLLWEMLAGRRLFDGADDRATIQAVAACNVAPLSSLNPRVPAEVEELAFRMLASDPEQRAASGAEVVSYINQFFRKYQLKGGASQIAELVQRYGTPKAEREQSGGIVAQLLTDELIRFTEDGADTLWDVGVEPLDPNEFAF